MHRMRTPSRQPSASATSLPTCFGRPQKTQTGWRSGWSLCTRRTLGTAPRPPTYSPSIWARPRTCPTRCAARSGPSCSCRWPRCSRRAAGGCTGVPGLRWGARQGGVGGEAGRGGGVTSASCAGRGTSACGATCASLLPNPPRTPALCLRQPQSQELKDVELGRAFGATLDLKAVGQPLGPDTLVPGVAVYRCACGWRGCCSMGWPPWLLGARWLQSRMACRVGGCQSADARWQPCRAAAPSTPALLARLPARLPTPHPLPAPHRCSRRADPLAAWTNGLDLAAVTADTDRAFLILETGFNQRWRCACGLRPCACIRSAAAAVRCGCTPATCRQLAWVHPWLIGGATGAQAGWGAAWQRGLGPCLEWPAAACCAGTAPTAARWRRQQRRRRGRRRSRRSGAPPCAALHVCSAWAAAALLAARCCPAVHASSHALLCMAEMRAPLPFLAPTPPLQRPALSGGDAR